MIVERGVTLEENKEKFVILSKTISNPSSISIKVEIKTVLYLFFY